MKKTFLIIALSLFMSFSTVANAGSAGGVMSVLQNLQGEWYTLDDFQTLVVKGNVLSYAGKTFYVQDILDIAGGATTFGAKFIVKDKYGNTIPVRGFCLGIGSNAKHQRFTFDDIDFKRFKQDYFESIGGIYIGMSKNQLLALYGNPDKIEEHRYGGDNYVYLNFGMQVRIYKGEVYSINIYGYGDRKFDRSGLSATSKMNEFEHAYGGRIIKRSDSEYILHIGNNERLSFGSGGVMLELEDYFS